MSAVALQLDHGRVRASRRRSPSDELRDLARQVLRIHDPYRASPEATLIAENNIAVRLRQLADSIEG